MNDHFIIQQFEDKPLSHYSYAVTSGEKMVLIDPARDPQPYYDYAEMQNATIVGVIETHPHADFVSSNLEIHDSTKATVYASKLTGAEYPHISFDDEDKIMLGNVTLRALNTPGHSPDSICIVLESDGKDQAVFTGDTLFIGDCGRPDLRENAGNITASRENLAKDMYRSLRDKLLPLGDDVTVYPTHGAGTLCGKALKEANKSTIGEERNENWSLQEMTEPDFVEQLIAEQPIVPKYFGFDVALNRKGAAPFATCVAKVKRLDKIVSADDAEKLDSDILIIDTRPQDIYKKGHLDNSFNIMMGGKFETWLGSIVEPNEPFYLMAETEAQLDELLGRIAKIGYETQIKAAFVGTFMENRSDTFELDDFKEHPDNFTIIDVRNASEVKEKKIFAGSINIPLSELWERIDEIPTGKPIIVHCAGGYRSAAGSSIIKTGWKNRTVYDLGEAVTTF